MHTQQIGKTTQNNTDIWMDKFLNTNIGFSLQKKKKKKGIFIENLS